MAERIKGKGRDKDSDNHLTMLVKSFHFFHEKEL